MRVNAKRPRFMPRDLWEEIDKIPKAVLMDVLWTFAQFCVRDGETVSERLRLQIKTVREHP